MNPKHALTKPGSETELGPRAKEVLVYVFDNPTHNQRQIAHALGISNQRVSQIMSNKRFLAALPHVARAKVQGMVPEAVAVQRELMRQKKNLEVSRKVSESVLASQKVLDAAPNTQINVYSHLEINDLRKIVDSSKEIQSSVIDVPLADTQEV